MPNNSTAGNGKDTAREARRQIADHKGAWRNRLLADRRVSNAAKVVGCAIAEHVNRNSKEASVGVRRLALILDMYQSQVSKAVHELADAGLIEVEWGVQGGRKVPSAFKLIINLETPDLFSFNKYDLAAFIEAETEFARQNSTEFTRQNSKVHPAELYRVQKKGRASSKNKPTEFTKKAERVHPGEQNPGNPGNPVGTTGFTTDDDRESAPTNSATDGPVARTAHAALNDHLAAQKQPTPSATAIDAGPNGADAAAFDAMRRAQFADLRRNWPRVRVDEGKAFAVFLRVMVGHRLSDVIEAVNLTLVTADGVPWLSEALTFVERDLAITTNEPAQEDER